MTTSAVIGKAIWRLPDTDKIYFIDKHVGTDEFIIAPFNRNDNTITFQGKITEADQYQVSIFFNDIKLNRDSLKHSTSKEDYIESIGKAIDAIQNNVFEKVVLARSIFIEKTINLHHFFLQLTNHYKSAFVYCFLLENGTCMIGATPETLLKYNDESLITEALGGTAQINGYSDKEYLEHSQITDDISNKLVNLSFAFSKGDTKIKQAGNVSHLATEFRIKAKSVTENLNLVRVLHPTAAVCGLPFEPALDFIIRTEDFDRKYYTGYIGIKTKEDFNFFVNLRCAEIFENGISLYAGAGINKDSVPESEWLETNHKLDTLLVHI